MISAMFCAICARLRCAAAARLLLCLAPAFWLQSSQNPAPLWAQEAQETQEAPRPEQREQNQTMNLGFAGDIMAHDSNYNMQDFSRIYQRVRPLLNQSDLPP